MSSNICESGGARHRSGDADENTDLEDRKVRKVFIKKIVWCRGRCNPFLLISRVV